MSAATCGIDWGEGHHDIAIVNGSGVLVAKARINEDPEGLVLGISPVPATDGG